MKITVDSRNMTYVGCRHIITFSSTTINNRQHCLFWIWLHAISEIGGGAYFCLGTSCAWIQSLSRGGARGRFRGFDPPPPLKKKCVKRPPFSPQKNTALPEVQVLFVFQLTEQPFNMILTLFLIMAKNKLIPIWTCTSLLKLDETRLSFTIRFYIIHRINMINRHQVTSIWHATCKTYFTICKYY